MGDAFADDWAPPQYEGACDYEAGNKQKVTVLARQEKRRELVRKAVAPRLRRQRPWDGDTGMETGVGVIPAYNALTDGAFPPQSLLKRYARMTKSLSRSQTCLTSTGQAMESRCNSMSTYVNDPNMFDSDDGLAAYIPPCGKKQEQQIMETGRQYVRLSEKKSAYLTARRRMESRKADRWASPNGAAVRAARLIAKGGKRADAEREAQWAEQTAAIQTLLAADEQASKVRGTQTTL